MGESFSQGFPFGYDSTGASTAARDVRQTAGIKRKGPREFSGSAAGEAENNGARAPEHKEPVYLSIHEFNGS